MDIASDIVRRTMLLITVTRNILILVLWGHHFEHD